MLFALALLAGLLQPDPPAVESLFEQVAPAPDNGKATRSADQTHAVVLIHGYHIYLQDRFVPRAEFRPWQRGESNLAKELANNADVFAFAYGQDVAIDTIVAESKLRDGIVQLRKLGYRDIVLMGHSAGGLIARQFVEDYPDAGVTGVIQVCTPNGGSPLAGLFAMKSQRAFMQCLTENGRQECLKMRTDKRIPAKVQFVCVVGITEEGRTSDGVVSCLCQWTEDLQKQGIPAVKVVGDHRAVVRDAKVAEILAHLVRENQPRWDAEQIDKAKKEIFGD
jgi:pimeloyl-ACP methyl ester carboxylesterase